MDKYYGESISISYEDFFKLIHDYYKFTQGLELDLSLGGAFTTLSDFKTSFSRDRRVGSNNNVNKPVPIKALDSNTKGSVRIDGHGIVKLSKEMIEKIAASYCASISRRFNSISFSDKNISITSTFDPNMDRENAIDESTTSLPNVVYGGHIGYSQLRQIIVEYYKKETGTEIRTISIQYLVEKLNNPEKMNDGNGFFIKPNGERFDMSTERIFGYIKQYFDDLGLSLIITNPEYIEDSFKLRDQKIEFEYTRKQDFEKEKSLEEKDSEFRKVVQELGWEFKDKMPEIEKPEVKTEKSETKVEKVDEKPVEDNGVNLDVNSAVKNGAAAEIARMMREGRRFEILHRERELNAESRRRNVCIAMAAVALAGACIGIYFSGVDKQQMLDLEIKSLTSWSSFVEYIKNLGTLPTLLTAGTVVLAGSAGRHARRVDDIRGELEDYNASLENNNELGGEDNARSR